MVLAYLDSPLTQEELARRLGIRPHIGAPASRVLRLRSPALDVVYTEGDLHTLTAWLEAETPVIVFVQVDQLPYWRGQHFQHALLVIGADSQHLYLLDPATGPAPLAVSHGDFLLAWEAMEYAYAVIRRSSDEKPIGASR